MKITLFALAITLSLACTNSSEQQVNLQTPIAVKNDKVTISSTEWKKELSTFDFHVTREKGTERPFTGKYYNHHEKGVYLCKCCEQPLFNSESKFDSGTGWPSFFLPYHPSVILEKKDNSLGMSRTEVLCKRCDAHLGHVFTDGPKPSGLRYCINSASLIFEKTNP